MLILHVRHSEVALADGRLDEAYAVATAHDVGRHRRGQRLITRLVDALVRRGQEHAAAGRYAAALADCEKAAKLGGNRSDVVALRAAAADAMARQHRQQQRQVMALATAKRHVNDGELSLGEQLLAAAEDASRAGFLREDIDRRRRAAGEAVRACGQALKAGDVERAARELLRARSADAHHRDLIDLTPRTVSAVTDQLHDAIESGHLDRGGELLRHLRTIDPTCPHARRHEALLDGLRAAWRRVQSGDLAEARVAVARLLPMTENAPWLERVAGQLRQAEAAITDLKVGPLAWLGERAAQVARVAADEPARRLEAQHHVMPQRSEQLPTQFMLHVDGVGSFLVLREPVVTIGPISAPVAADVAVVAEPTLPPVTVARLDDDYFLKASGQSTSAGRLLASGECLDLSPRCRLTFRLPSPASTSAVIDLTGARLPRADVRRVILMDQDLIIGPGSASHAVAPQLDRPLVLHVRQGRLVCPGHEGGISMGESVSAGGVSFVVASVDGKGR